MKTRRFLGWVAMATMVLSTGCSNDELVNDYSPENAIQFGTYVGRDAQSRGTVITTDGSAVTNGPTTTAALTTEGFGVFAYYTGDSDFDEWTGVPNFMYNEKVTGTSSGQNITWTYSPIKYWPTTKEHKVSFFAYAPYDNDLPYDNNGDDSTNDADGKNRDNIELSENNVGGAPTVTYTVPSTVMDQVDLLWANPVLDATRQGVDEKIEFKFNHALSRIGFKVEALIDKVNNDDEDGEEDSSYGEGKESNETTIALGTTITVTNVTLSGLFYEKGKMNLKSVKKTDDSGDSYSPDLWNDRSCKKSDNDDNENISYILVDANFTDNKSVSNKKEQLNKDDSYIMIIPKNFKGNDKITVTVEYEVKTEDDKLAGGYSVINNTVTSEGFNFNFEPGKAYNFVLHIGLTSVKFSADVNDWDEITDQVVNVPINTGTNPVQP